jgi:hypothetical protein
MKSGSQDSSVSIVTDWMVPGFDSWRMQEILLNSTASRPALGPPQPPIQWVWGIFRQGMKLTTHFHLLPR